MESVLESRRRRARRWNDGSSKSGILETPQNASRESRTKRESHCYVEGAGRDAPWPPQIRGGLVPGLRRHPARRQIHRRHLPRRRACKYTRAQPTLKSGAKTGERERDAPSLSAPARKIGQLCEETKGKLCLFFFQVKLGSNASPPCEAITKLLNMLLATRGVDIERESAGQSRERGGGLSTTEDL